MDDVVGIGHDADMAGEENQIAAFQPCTFGQVFTKIGHLHIGVARGHDAFQAKNQLDKAGAINRIPAASTPAIGRADKLLCQIRRRCINAPNFRDMRARHKTIFARQIFATFAQVATEQTRAHRVARQHRRFRRWCRHEQGRRRADDMRCGKIIPQFGKAQIAQIIVMQAISPCPFARDIQHRKFFAMHQRADRHRCRMGLGMDFRHGCNTCAQHGHGIMRREKLSSQADIGKVASDWRCPFVPDKAMPA